MNMIPHDNRDGFKVWLEETEVSDMLSTINDTQREIAVGLGVRCGLRSAEWLDVHPRHVIQSNQRDGYFLRVPSGKGDKYRETPIPVHLAGMIRATGDVSGGPDEPVLDVSSTRTLRRWVQDVGTMMAEKTNDEGWLELSTHDLRRTWGTNLSEHDVDPLLALQWGGWNDLETFLDHYKGVYSPEAQQRNRDKVPWL